MKLKIDHATFKTMRREKLVPKVLGKAVSKGSEMEPYSLREDQGVRQLIKDTASLKETAHTRASETWDALKNATNAHLTTRPGILQELQSYCNGRVAKVKAEYQRKADHNLKTQIANSKWERMARPGVVIDMSGNRINKTEKNLLSFGLKFSTGLNNQTPLDVAKALNSFRHRHRHDLNVPSVEFIQASVIPHLDYLRDTLRHLGASLPRQTSTS